ncbi:MAG: DUF2478 domain-containing protein [Xanthobacteraceae bacterium]|nr:DUF2478 domain-containing protein [Xanthobacteraceae bacterium]
MSVPHSAPDHEAAADERFGVAALVYRNENYPEAAFARLVERARGLKLKLAGVLQYPAFEGADRRCDVVLEDLASGHRTALFEDRGPGARGCRLDEAALAEATARIEGSLETGPQLLVLSKFGKVECDGGGLRDLIAAAIDRDIPVIIGVPERNLEAWRLFSGGLAVELSEDDDEIARWVESIR